MTLRIAVTAIVVMGLSLMLARADGMPEPEDQNYNPVPSVPGVPAPGVKQPAPVKAVKPAPAPPPEPVTEAAPVPSQPPAAPPAAPTPAPATAPTPAPVASTPPPAPVTTPAALRKPVYEVLSVDVQLNDRNPPFVIVTVKGTTRTGGWKNIELHPLQTFAPEVGMRSFTLVGTPPSGVSTQAITPVNMTIRIDPLPDGVKTIRVLAETNEVAQTFR